MDPRLNLRSSDQGMNTYGAKCTPDIFGASQQFPAKLVALWYKLCAAQGTRRFRSLFLSLFRYGGNQHTVSLELASLQ